MEDAGPSSIYRTVFRVLHDGRELPTDQPLHRIVNQLLLQRTQLSPAPSGSQQSYAQLPERETSTTFTLQIQCAHSGDSEQTAQPPSISCVSDLRARSSSSASSEPLTAMARHHANIYFDYYWSRSSDGAPHRYTDTECWQPGVQAAVVSTITHLLSQGTSIEATPVLAFMQDKAVRQFGEVRNGHKFKRPPSKRSMLRYRAIAAEWRQRYSQHQLNGTVPVDICETLSLGEGLLLPWKGDSSACRSARASSVPVPALEYRLSEEPAQQLLEPCKTLPAEPVEPFLEPCSLLSDEPAQRTLQPCNILSEESAEHFLEPCNLLSEEATEQTLQPCSFMSQHEPRVSREPSEESDMFSSPFLSADLDDSWLSSLVAELLPQQGLVSNVSSAHSAAVLPQEMKAPHQAPDEGLVHSASNTLGGATLSQEQPPTQQEEPFYLDPEEGLMTSASNTQSYSAALLSQAEIPSQQELLIMAPEECLVSKTDNVQLAALLSQVDFLFQLEPEPHREQPHLRSKRKRSTADVF